MKCPQCGAKVQPTDAYCMDCGKFLVQAHGPEPPPAPAAQPQPDPPAPSPASLEDSVLNSARIAMDKAGRAEDVLVATGHAIFVVHAVVGVLIVVAAISLISQDMSPRILLVAVPSATLCAAWGHYIRCFLLAAGAHFHLLATQTELLATVLRRAGSR